MSLHTISHELARRIPLIHQDSVINNAGLIEEMLKPLIPQPGSVLLTKESAARARFLIENIAVDVYQNYDAMARLKEVYEMLK